MKHLVFTIVLCGCFFTLKPYISEAPKPPRDMSVKGIIYYWADKYKVSPIAMEKVIQCESGGKPEATNINKKEYSVGVSQINLRAHKDITEQEARDPDFAVEFMAKNFAKGKKNMWSCAKIMKV